MALSEKEKDWLERRKILCTHCGVTTLTIRRNSMFDHYFVECDVCWMQGPRAFWSDSAVNKWNSLPRRHEIMPNDVDCAGCPERRYRRR